MLHFIHTIIRVSLIIDNVSFSCHDGLSYQFQYFLRFSCLCYFSMFNEGKEKLKIVFRYFSPIKDLFASFYFSSLPTKLIT